MASRGERLEQLESELFPEGARARYKQTRHGREYVSTKVLERDTGRLRGVRVQSLRRGRGRGLIQPSQPA